MDIQAVAVQDAPQKQALSSVVDSVADGSATPVAPAVPSTTVTSTASSSSTAAVSQSSKNEPLSSSIGKFFGTPDAPQQIDVQVSYRIDKYDNQIVTVFTDPHTGKEIAQFPKEIMLQIAQFFDQQSGVTLDRNA
jgi:uncharacterized FlaG/YvyC family protein